MGQFALSPNALLPILSFRCKDISLSLGNECRCWQELNFGTLCAIIYVIEPINENMNVCI